MSYSFYPRVEVVFHRLLVFSSVVTLIGGQWEIKGSLTLADRS